MICTYFWTFFGPCTKLRFTAYAHVRTEPQCDIGHTRGKKITLVALIGTNSLAQCVMIYQATRWLSWYSVGLASADRLPVVIRIPAGPLGSLKCDPPKGNGRRPQKKVRDDLPTITISCM